MSIDAGETVVLRYRVSGASSVSIEPDLLPRTTMAEGMVTTPPLVESTVFTLRATSPAGDTTRALAITVRTAEMVQIISFEATPRTVAPGESAELAWQVAGATAIRVAVKDGAVLQADAPAQGTLGVTPDANTTYVLSAEGTGGPVTAEVTVLVGTAPVIDNFVVHPAQVAPGETAVLEWTARNATALVLRDSAGNTILPSAPAAGVHSVMPAVTTEYQLVASSPVGDVIASATVMVVEAGAPRILLFTASPETLPAPGLVTLTWNVADSDTVDMTANGMPFSAFPRTPMGMVSTNIPRTAELVLRAENTFGVTTANLTITVGEADNTPPIITYTPIAGVQPERVDVSISATMADLMGSGMGSATLFYRTRGQALFESTPMTSAGNDRYSAVIPGAFVVAPGVDYYLHAGDLASPPNVATDPAAAPADLHTFDVQAPDTDPPVIVHTPAAGDQPENAAVTVSAQVTDASAIGSVTLLYKRRTEATYTSAAMALAGGNYTAQIPGTAMIAPGVDYYLEAADAAAPPNTGRSPATAPAVVHTLNVVARDTTPPAIVHTAIAAGQPTGLPVTVNANVTDASGLGTVTLYYRTQGGGAYSQTAMTGIGTTKSAAIPGGVVVAPGVEYYLEATDGVAPPNTSRHPSTAPSTPHVFSVAAADLAAPSIAHTPITDGRAANQPVTIQATVTDGSGIASVTLYYRTTGAATYSSAVMTGGPTYTAQIPAGTVVAPGVDYYLRAVDASPAMNAAVLPATAPGTGYSFTTGRSEIESNNTTGTANLLLGAGLLEDVALGAIGTIADRDYWYFDVPAGQAFSVRLELTSGGEGLCPAPVNTTLTLFASNGTTVLVNDNTHGVGSCSLIDPATDAAARALAAGRYYVRVEETGDNATIGAYELRTSLSPAVCGNNILEVGAGEQCDDGSTAGGDGCSATCRLETEGNFAAPGAALSAAISPAGDVDVFSVVISAGAFLRAEVSSGAGACPGNTVLELYGPDGVTLLGSDDDDGIDQCSLIDPLTDGIAANMAAGTYFLRVRAFDAATVIAAYVLDVRITSSLCGNLVAEPGEQCDDGNSTAGDGCSSTCQWELAGTASGSGASFTESIDPAANRDYYEVVVQEGASIEIETFSPSSGVCSSGVDTVIRVFGSDRTTQLATDDESGIGSCSHLDPAVDPEVRNLAAGTYYVTVEDWLRDDVIGTYVLDIQITLPVCGDGLVAGTEQCDDGNTTANDGCSATCTLEGNSEVEPNDSRAEATLLADSGVAEATINGAIQSPDDVDTYRIVLAATAQVFAEVTNGQEGCPATTPDPLVVRLLSSTGTQLATDSGDGPGACGRISPGGDSGARSLAAGTYYLEVSGPANVSYRLHTRVLTPGCGDTYLLAGEQCDDGNTNAGDGCSATCQFETVEVEPNDTFAMAMELVGPLRVVSGRINVGGEQDWYRVTVAAGGSLHVGVNNGGVDQCGSIDPDVEVFGPDSGTTSIGFDDLDGTGNCAILYRSELWNLAAGTYYIKVDGYSASATFDYVLNIEVF